MKATLKIAALLLLSFVANMQLYAMNEKFTPTNNKKLAVVYTSDKNIDKEFFHFVKKDLDKIGFFVNDPHHNVNKVYEQNFGKTELDNLAFSSMFDDKDIRPLLNIDPRLGGFSPFNLITYRKKSDMKTVITHITPEAMLDILQITNKSVRSKLIEAFKPLDKAIEEKFETKKSYFPLHGYAKKSMINFEIPFEEPEDIDDFMDEFEEKFKTAFEEQGYIIAGFYDVKNSFNSDDDVMPDFTSYWTFSLCHIPFSYAVFDGENAFPEAGIFAPCSMYVYVREGENKIVIGMPTLNAWAAAMNITDPKKLEKINQLDEEIPDIIHSLGGIDVPNVNPLTKK